MLRRTIAACAGLALIVCLLAGATAVTGAQTTTPAAVRVHSASLVQDGQRLVWRVVTDDPFTPTSLRAARQSLCLVIYRTKPVRPVAELCIAHSGSRSHPKLYYSRISRSGVVGAAHLVVATVTRRNGEQLTASFLPASFGATYRSLRWQVLSTSAATGCSPVLAACDDALPVRPAFAKLHTPKLVGCVASGPSLVYGGSSKVHDIALSFDDGPWPDPPSIEFVNLLAREHVPATFFEIGDQISEYDSTGSVERQMLADGDMIGDHTWTHPDMSALSPASQTSELELTVHAIQHATGFTPCLWRPPYGDQDPQLDSLARSLGMATIMWNIDPRDWSLPGVGAIENVILSTAVNGGIVEEHFGGGPRYETIDALPHVIAVLRARGYKFVTITQMLGYKLIYK